MFSHRPRALRASAMRATDTHYRALRPTNDLAVGITAAVVIFNCVGFITMRQVPARPPQPSEVSAAQCTGLTRAKCATLQRVSASAHTIPCIWAGDQGECKLRSQPASRKKAVAPPTTSAAASRDDSKVHPTASPPRRPTRTFTALGGSNTLGQGAGRSHSFAALTAGALQHRNMTDLFQNSALGAMGPTMFAACGARYVPGSTVFATVEFLPNMGHSGGADTSEAGAVGQLLRTLQQIGATAVLVLIVPAARPPMCSSCVDPPGARRLQKLLEGLARTLSVPTVSVDASSNRSLFGSDRVHLNVAGHAHVHAQLMKLFLEWPQVQPRAHLTQGDPELNVTEHTFSSVAASEQPRSHDGGLLRQQRPAAVDCRVGHEVSELVSLSRNFALVDLAAGRGAEKPGWETRVPGSELRLCFNLNADEPGVTRTAHRLAIGIQTSHPLNLPLFGPAHFACVGCACSSCWNAGGRLLQDCDFDTLTNHSATGSQTSFSSP